MRTGIIIQARMGSTRLPGKVMKLLAGKEILWHVVKRCQQSKLADEVIVATSDTPGDDIIEKFCAQHGFSCYRGSESDVLARFYDAAGKFKLDVVVRITSDCPLIDPIVIDESLRLFRTKKVDYLSNCLDRVFPRGLDTEVFSFQALERAHREAKEPFEREHVTPYITKHGTTAPYSVPAEYRGDFRLTIDEQIDYDLLKRVYSEFYRDDQHIIDVRQVIRFLWENPTLARLNADVVQKASIR
ncbi:MAG: hypothetical protein A3B30_02705 [Candidatus Komeilibacteria bacterium RIFCSPLOWO2_01_FULL_52_15]|uniref:Acylneuraminate cytidylyltransferase n=2 Tax=Candidatus Komeiliibacteriota TaxID=1817908 RepID=A0A1G2BPI7_9BACT|nr:MAG: hypothetical protein A2677_04265 [Candidatus Komeilibacteria bacterium RIFCSPHIGHO2_01_FULL_52_14]OGY90270.1 MAG: hypothetical protein A3B30_02705 [Candidatus Komeilibacteria bacterium RIFCSPLOWO2_01_FULL_52_15]